MIATRRLGRPSVGATLGAGPQVIGAQLVKAAGMNVQFERGRPRREAARASFGQEVADEWSGETMDELWLFTSWKVARKWIFRFGLVPVELAGKSRTLSNDTARPPSTSLQTALRLRPRRALSSAEATGSYGIMSSWQWGGSIIPLLIAQTFPLLIEPRQPLSDDLTIFLWDDLAR